MYDWLIVGAGFAGSVLAERLAQVRGDSVLVIDKRNHIAGNAYDRFDDAGVLMHQYGPHIFHTNSKRILDHLGQFTDWRFYEHRVLASIDGKLVPIPINRTTVNAIYGLSLATDEEAEAFFQSRAEPVDIIRTSEDVVVSRVGRDLYEKFFQGYSRKQWGLDPSQLDKSVTARVPTRANTDDRYFTDTFQFMPKHGYTRMFERMLSHPKISVMLKADYKRMAGFIPFRRLIFTGPIDEFFDFRFGKLPYRSLQFVHKTLNQEHFQPTGTVNYPCSEDYTRISEYKYLTGQSHPQTTITYEYPSDEGDPYYPVPRPENQERYKKYEALTKKLVNTFFVGRLATYRYYNMDQVVAQALTLFSHIEETVPQKRIASGVRALNGVRPSETALDLVARSTSTSQPIPDTGLASV